MRLFGSSLILAGTALGAGMLAIPMVLAQFGFYASTILMLFIFIGTTYSALLLAEACTKTKGHCGMSTIAYLTLGSKFKHFINALFYLLLICLMIAYLLGVGDLFHKILGSFGVNSSPAVSYTIFCLLMGAVVAAGTKHIDKLNRALFIVMVVMLLIVIGYLSSNIHLSYIDQASHYTFHDVLKYSAVIFTSFGSMVVIPSLVTYNEGATPKQIRNMVLLGGFIPLACYLAWLFTIIGNMGVHTVSQFHSISELIASFSYDKPFIKEVSSIFSALALITSFLGVSMALYDQNKDAVSNNTLVSFGLTFIIPLILTKLFADQFVGMLSYAGMILVFLAVWGPLAMVVKLRQPAFDVVNERIELDGSYTAGGGKIALITTFLFGVVVFISWFMK